MAEKMSLEDFRYKVLSHVKYGHEYDVTSLFAEYEQGEKESGKDVWKEIEKMKATFDETFSYHKKYSSCIDELQDNVYANKKEIEKVKEHSKQIGDAMAEYVVTTEKEKIELTKSEPKTVAVEVAEIDKIVAYAGFLGDVKMMSMLDNLKKGNQDGN